MDTYGPAIIRWMAVGVVFGGAALYYYSEENKKHRTRRTGRQSFSDPTKEFANGIDSIAAEAANAKAKAKKRKPAPKPKTEPEEKPASTPPVYTTKAAANDGVDNAAFAKMMADTRKGTVYTGQTTEKRIRTVKQSKSKSEESNASSTTGADADDDLSPAHSPTFASNNVADMLEPAQPGPSVLSIKPPANPAPAKKTHQPKPELAAETKKQRQNRLKNEEKRLLREESEKARRTLEEQQRRSAREARGEPAKNGIPVAPPATNAWTAPAAPKANGNAVAPPVEDSGLLDTFEVVTRKSRNNAASRKTTTAAPAVQSPAVQSPLPTEEEQEAWAQEDKPWSTVENKKGKKKKTNAGATDSDGSGVDTAKPEPKKVQPAPVAAAKPATNGTLTNGHTPISHPFTPSVADSDWAA